MKVNGEKIWFRSDWSGDKASFRKYCKEKETHWNCGSCPYWIGHAFVMDRYNSDLIQDRWSRRGCRNYGRVAYRLYWRTHKKEWEAVQALQEKRKGIRGYADLKRT